MELEESGIQPGLHSKFQTTWGNMRSCLKETETKAKTKIIMIESQKEIILKLLSGVHLSLQSGDV